MQKLWQIDLKWDDLIPDSIRKILSDFIIKNGEPYIKRRAESKHNFVLSKSNNF